MSGGPASAPAGEPPSTAPLSPEELKAIGAYDQDEAAASAWARVLVIGPAKVGKTSALAATAPGPVLVLNCDGDSALQPAKANGGRFVALDVTGEATFKKHLATAQKLCAAGKFRTVILDSVSLFADTLLDEMTVSAPMDQRRWGSYGDFMMKGLKNVLKLPAHVFLVAHLLPPKADDEEGAGILPMIKGSTRRNILAYVNDAVIFDYVPNRTPNERQFLIGPQTNWSFKGRNVKRSIAVPATVPAMFAEMGIKP